MILSITWDNERDCK